METFTRTFLLITAFIFVSCGSTLVDERSTSSDSDQSLELRAKTSKAVEVSAAPDAEVKCKCTCQGPYSTQDDSIYIDQSDSDKCEAYNGQPCEGKGGKYEGKFEGCKTIWTDQKTPAIDFGALETSVR